MKKHNTRMAKVHELGKALTEVIETAKATGVDIWTVYDDAFEYEWHFCPQMYKLGVKVLERLGY